LVMHLGSLLIVC